MIADGQEGESHGMVYCGTSLKFLTLDTEPDDTQMDGEEALKCLREWKRPQSIVVQ